MNPEGYVRRQEEALGWKIGIVSFKLGDCYHCAVDNVEPGALLARGEGSTREEAERQALERAREMLAKTRRLPLPA